MTGFSPIFPIPVIAALVGSAVVLALVREARLGVTRNGWRRYVLAGLRMISLGLMAILLLNPSYFREQAADPIRPLILIDGSDSMSLAAGDGEGTRWQEALRFGEAVAGHEARASFASFSHELKLSSGIPLGPELPGGSTLLAKSLESLIASGQEVSSPVIIVSDGRIFDRRGMTKALALARDRGVTLAAYCVGSDETIRNARVDSVFLPDIIRPQSQVSIEVTTSTSGFGEEELELILRDDSDDVVVSELVMAGEEVRSLLRFEGPLDTTEYRLELRSSGAPEISSADNDLAITIPVASKNLRVLFLEGSHALHPVGKEGHAWNQIEFMTRAWEFSGEIDFELLTVVNQHFNGPNLRGVSFQNGQIVLDESRGFPATREELNTFDVILMSDISVGNFTDEQLQWVLDWVAQRGGGFLMAGGHSSFDTGSYDETLWEKLIPVDVKSFGAGISEGTVRVTIPESVRRHPIWKILPDSESNDELLKTIPVFHGMNRVSRAKPGALVLATRQTRGVEEPVIAVQTYGRGRTLAFLPDPNGYWGHEFIRWGSSPELPVGNWVILEANGKLTYDAEATVVPPNPPTSHPSPHFGQVWVNIVKWLGEKSIRWRNRSLVVRSLRAFATPGEYLPVAVEMLGGVTPAEMFDADVGARLTGAGASRTRLEYDRDQRQFVGSILIPDDLSGDAVEVFFDATRGERSTSESLKVGVLRNDPELTQGQPDPEFLSEVAEASGGPLLGSVGDALRFLEEVSTEQSLKSQVIVVPRWPRWPFWLLLASCLSLEWTLRRREKIQLTAS
ncbi:glutamine amidotransferase [Verrucomicrobiaceae bacterium 227]